MVEETTKKRLRFSDFIYILYKWKKFLIINMVIIILIIAGITLLLPNTYKSTATVMVPPQSTLDLGSITGLISGKSSSTASFGAKLLGLSSTSDDIIYGLLNSRTILSDVIQKFNLESYYKIHIYNKLLKAFKEDLSFEPTDYGMIDISVINESPEISAEIANYLVKKVDSLNIQINIHQAMENRMFIEKRYLQNVDDLQNAEDSLYFFQKATGVIAIPQQLEVEVKAAAELEAQLVQKQLAVDLLKKKYGVNSPIYSEAISQVNFIKEKINQLKNSQSLSSSSNIFLPFQKIPQLTLNYYKYYREIELQSKIMEVLLPIYEQAKFEEQKSIPTLYVVDKAIPPDLKYGPKRSLIVAGVTLLAFFILIIVIYVGEKSLTAKSLDNPLEEKINRIFNKIKNLYKLKFS